MLPRPLLARVKALAKTNRRTMTSILEEGVEIVLGLGATPRPASMRETRAAIKHCEATICPEP